MNCGIKQITGQQTASIDTGGVRRKPGRPRAIPESVIPDLLRLYHEGLGYRAVARELSKEGVSADWSTVRRVIKSRGSVDNA
jgi:hypothetical protein